MALASEAIGRGGQAEKLLERALETALPDRIYMPFAENGAALEGLIQLVETAGGTVAGCGVAIEKAFQPGGELIRSRGYRVEALARISSMSDDGKIEFCR